MTAHTTALWRARMLAMVVGVGLVASVLPAAGQRSTTVVVVPFTNVSQRPADDWIGAGIAETVSADLQNAGLVVVGHRPVERILIGNGGSDDESSEHDAALVASRERGVMWLVDGSLQRAGDLLTYHDPRRGRRDR